MIIEIEQFYRDGDSDWSAAMERAQQWRHSDALDDAKGLTVLFGPRNYNFGGTIQLVRSMSLVGSGGTASGASTTFTFPHNTAGIVLYKANDAFPAPPVGLNLSNLGYEGDSYVEQRAKTAAEPQPVGGADFSLIQNIKFIGDGDPTSTAHGIEIRGTAILRDVSVISFGGDGIHIEGTLKTDGGSGSLWQIYNCRTEECGGDGLHVHGDDANAGCAIALSSADNKGWGIFEASLMGNTYIACHTSSNKLGAYSATHASASSMFLGCYQENDQTSSITWPSIILGGSIGTDQGAIQLTPSGGFAHFTGQLRADSPKLVVDPANPIHDHRNRIVCGILGGGAEGTALELRSLGTAPVVITGGVETDPGNGDQEVLGTGAIDSEDFYSIRFGMSNGVGVPGWWDLRYGNLGGPNPTDPMHNPGALASPLRFSAREATTGPAQLWMPNGVHFGVDVHTPHIKVEAGTAPPSSPATNLSRTAIHQIGDVVLNTNPADPTDPNPGTKIPFAGWICTEAGSPGTWRPYGRIEKG